MADLADFESHLAERLRRRAQAATRPFDPVAILGRAVLSERRSRRFVFGGLVLRNLRLAALGATVVAVILAVGALVLGGAGPLVPPAPTASARPTLGTPHSVLPTEPPCPVPAYSLAPGATARALHPWPGSRGDDGPGSYSWLLGAQAWMHKVSNGTVGVQLSFRLDATPLPGAAVTGSTIAGEPAERRELLQPEDGTRVIQWIVPGLGGTAVDLMMTIDPNASEATIAEGFAVIRSMRLEPAEQGCAWILVFDTLGGWDAG